MCNALARSEMYYFNKEHTKNVLDCNCENLGVYESVWTSGHMYGVVHWFLCTILDSEYCWNVFTKLCYVK